MPGNINIVDLMKVPTADQDIGWLVDALHAAIKLELATIPPYLAAYWSIKDRNHPAARSILTVVMEEMLHLGLVCNLLVAVGGTPELAGADTLPAYPTTMPAGVRPGLVVPLAGFSKEAARRFMDIEMPLDGPDAEGVETADLTIGAFYTAIHELFDMLSPALATDRQLEGVLDLFKIEKPDDVRAALNLIRRQGEGAHGSPMDTGPHDLSHYYRFAEIFHGKRFARDPATGDGAFDGAEFAFPEVWPMAEVPPGGYGADAPGEVAKLLARFDVDYTTVMHQLEDAWQSGDKDSLEKAVALMGRGLSGTALALIQIPRRDGAGTYGPCFRYRL